MHSYVGEAEVILGLEVEGIEVWSCYTSNSF